MLVECDVHGGPDPTEDRRRVGDAGWHTRYSILLLTLPEAAFCLRGHIVADLAIDSSVVIGAEVHATIAVLTLIDV